MASKIQDFIGFSFNNVHSSELGIIRTSDGSRFNEDLLPPVNDSVNQATGQDGSYIYASQYQPRTFNISFAFDSLTEKQIRQMRQLFKKENIGELVFDESPYKAYDVKVNGSPNIKYICFDKKEGNKVSRIYKGEGNVSFIAYYPLAHSRLGLKRSGSFSPSDYPNKNEWLEASGLIAQERYEPGTAHEDEYKYDHFVESGNDWVTFVHNSGDIDTPFWVTFSGEKGKTVKVQLYTAGGDIGTKKKEMQLTFTKDALIRVNSKLHLVEEVTVEGSEGSEISKPTGIVYNNFITSGDFFFIPNDKDYRIYVRGAADVKRPMISYKHWYF